MQCAILTTLRFKFIESLRKVQCKFKCCRHCIHLQTVCIHSADKNLLKIFQQKLHLLVNSSKLNFSVI